MLVDVRKLVDRIATRAGWKKSELGTRVFRHTWTAARLQTLDHGAPVSIYTVSRELGHGSEEMVRRVYAHLGTVRHRSEVVEFRIEQHLEALKDRLGNIGFVTRNVTREGAGVENEEPRDTEVSTGEDVPEWARRDSNARPLAPEPPDASAGWRRRAPVGVRHGLRAEERSPTLSSAGRLALR